MKILDKLKERTRGGSNWDEVIFITCLIVFLVGPFAIFGLWWWAGMMAFIGATVGITELIAKLVTGKTISQQFWAWSIKTNAEGKKINVWKAWLIIGCLCVGWGSLMWHLAIKMIGS